MTERLLAAFPAALLLFAGHLVWQDFGSAVWPGLLSAALLAFVLVALMGSGRIVLRAFAARDLSESEKTLIGATLGLGLLSQGVFLLGVLGWLSTGSISALLAVLWVAGFTETRDVLRSFGANLNLLRDRPLAAGGVLFFLAGLFWFTWVPPHQYDALVYHLPLAAAYAREGRIVPVEHLLYSHFPQNGEMLYTLALLLGSDLLAQMFTWLGTFLSVWWVFEMGKREAPASTVLLACLLVVTHSAVMLLTPTAYVECLVMLWVTAAVLSFLRWRERSYVENYPRGWLALSGIFAGLGLGTKYYAGITPALLFLALAARWARACFSHGEERLLRKERGWDALLFLGAASLTSAPWLVKNAVVVGNPVFPFFYRWLPPRGVAWGQESAERYFGILTEYGHHAGRFFTDLLKFPYLAAIGSARFGGGADVLGNPGWGLLLAALPIAAWGAWRTRYMRRLLAYCFAHWAIWYSTGVVLRFLVVLVPLLSLLTAHGLAKLRDHLGRSGKALLAAGAAGLLLANIGVFLYVHASPEFESLSVLLGIKSRQEYLSRLDYYDCARFARENLPQNDKILLVGEQRGYYVVQPHATTTPMAPNPFVLMANAASSPDDLARRLKEEGGYRYLLVAPRESARLSDYGVFHFTPEGLQRWQALEDGRVALVHDSPGRCALYRIK